MKRLLLGVIGALALATAAGAQIPNYQNGCPSCVVYSNVDIPGPGPAPVVGTGQPWGVAGWGFRCQDGQPTHRVDLFYTGDDGLYHPIPSSAILADYWDLNRPDVVAASVGTCPAIYGQWVGYTVIVAGGAVPAGTRTIAVNVWVGPYVRQETRLVTFQ